jgi:myo-inositol-1(or 4)-monophosphatase
LSAAELGSEILLKYFGKHVQISYKSKTDPVTLADKNSQKAIIGFIRKKYRGHGFLAEESGVEYRGEEFCWIIDPLDGTVNFTHGVSAFCVSIALKRNDEIICGVIYSPVMKEVFFAEKGKGAYLNGKRISVSKTTDMIRCLAVTGFPYVFDVHSERIFTNFRNLVRASYGIRRLGSAALDMAYVACGRFDYFWEETLKPWDIAAGALIVKEAGGSVSDFAGGKEFLVSGNTLASNNKIIHKKVLKILNEKR